MKFIYALIFIITLTATAYAADVRLDGNSTNVTALVHEGTSYVPVRAFFEKFYLNVEWSPTERTVTVSDGSNSFIYKIDSPHVTFNGNVHQMSSNTFLHDGTTYIPLRSTAELCNLTVAWNGEANRIILSNETYDEKDLYWLSRIIHAEAQGESMDGKIAVGNVVLNRVDDKDFPNDVYSVIFDTNHGVQFTPTANGTIYNNPSPDSIKAAKLALDSYSIVANCLYFVNPVLSPSSWAEQNRPFYKKIENHLFFC